MPEFHLVDLTNPEQAAYALAKYSRSALSITEAIKAITDESAAKFHEQFAVDNDYGHASIRDMAYAGMAMEHISMLAAITIEDESLWAGQERSTRYQDFKMSGYYTPEEARDGNNDYKDAIDHLFSQYATLTADLVELVTEYMPVPEGMTKLMARKTIQARVLDIMRSLLPFATLTSVGQINAARTLGPQLSRLMASPYKEIREVAAGMHGKALEILPTLLKHVAPSQQEGRYSTVVRYAVRTAIEPVLHRYNYDNAPVQLVDIPYHPVDEAVAAMIYQFVPGIGYGQALALRHDIGDDKANELYELALQERGPYDRWPRTHFTGGGRAWDILCDAKSMQDFFRHRRCIQIRQELMDITDKNNVRLALLPNVTANWFRAGLPSFLFNPDEPVYARLEKIMIEFDTAMTVAQGKMIGLAGNGLKEAATYAMPMGMKRRCLFKMDDEQTSYIIGTRSGVGGHFGYRQIADKMYEEFKFFNPVAARYTKVTRFEPLNEDTFWKR